MMTAVRLAFRSITYYWRTNLAVLLGVATAVAVLSGALLVGDSVRGSLRSMVLERLGRTDQVVLSAGFMGEQFVEKLQNDPQSKEFGLAPMIIAQGFVSVQGKGGRAGKVLVYGVDDRFWSFHGVSAEAPSDRELLMSPALSLELQSQPGDTLLIRTQKASDIPLESLHGRKEEATRTIRATVREILPRESMGEFSLQAQQGDVKAVFLPLPLLQRDLEVGSKFNTLLISGTSEAAAIESLMRKHTSLEDLGLTLRELKSGKFALESETRLIEEGPASIALALAAESGLKPEPLFTYLANSLRVGAREVPYSLVTAMYLPEAPPKSITLTDWAARELQAKPGDTVSAEYFLWEEPGRLVTRTAEFRVDRVVPTTIADAEMAPTYPGITDAAGLRDWDPPFPIDLRRIRPSDEEFWKKYGTTPKAFIPLEAGQALWKSRYGTLTSIRMTPPVAGNAASAKVEFEEQLRQRLDPLRSGIAVQNVRSESLDASRGATNFGEYFVYFSFFLVASAMLLSALFFKLNVERRVREVGLLRAVGLGPSTVRKIFLSEGLWLSVGGAVLGSAGAVLYAAAIVAALSTWWIGATGTGNITLHLSTVSIVLGAAGGVIAALGCIALTLRGLRNIPERSLLNGQLERDGVHQTRSSPRMALVFAALGFTLLIVGAAGAWSRTASFFGGGVLLLVATLLYFRFRLAKPSGAIIGGRNWPLAQMGVRNASFRPTRSVVAVATIASASFILISVNSFRKGAPEESVGGYTVLAESLVPIAYDLNSKEGLESVGLEDLQSVRFIEAFRVRPGDDASCLNLYEPKNPRILAPQDSFLNAGRFNFQSSMAATAEEESNPWQLLHRKEADGAIPVIADSNSMTYVLHRKLGEDFVITNHGQEVRLRFVAALSDSIFQSELLMSQENFLKLFPEQEGYSFFLIEAPSDTVEATTLKIENAMADYGVDATSTAARLAEFHRVENTYLSTFQMLGALGLFLGTAGLAAVLLRNILERRRELALLRTLGYGPRQFLVMTLVENALLLGGGLLIGTLCALLAIAPAALSEGGVFPGVALSILLGVLLLLGLGISALATKVALREAVLAALRSE